ncbi:hypothetical protein DFH09DRAFT_1077952 [Mycena vulgaris]|nr:hypothetical protein DFH09DRAFT_1077952 [Mycena vulgaris]
MPYGSYDWTLSEQLRCRELERRDGARDGRKVIGVDLMDQHSTSIPYLKITRLICSVGARLFARGDNPSLSNGEDSPFAYTAGPYVPTKCWSNSDFATGACCAHFNATRVAVKGSSIEACSFHDSGAWEGELHLEQGIELERAVPELGGTAQNARCGRRHGDFGARGVITLGESDINRKISSWTEDTGWSTLGTQLIVEVWLGALI